MQCMRCNNQDQVDLETLIFCPSCDGERAGIDALRAEVDELRGLLTRFVALNTDAEQFIREVDRNMLDSEEKADELLALMDASRALLENGKKEAKGHAAR